VESQDQSEREICRVIVLGRDGTEVLLGIAKPGFAFPAVEIPRGERLAENLTAALKRDWDCDAVCLFTPNLSSEDGNSNGKHYEVMECWRDGAHKDKTVWKPIPSLTADSFQEAAEFRLFEQSLWELNGYQHDPSSPFAKRGWLAELRRWTAEVIRPSGLELTGPLCQYNAGPSFSLIRFETDGPAVWFKAVGEPNEREFPITLNLSEQFPKYLPEIFGARADWNGWLSRDVEGSNLGDKHDIARWETAATELARLQIESVAKTESILEAGAHDLRIETLSALIHPFLTSIAQLMERQTKVPPPLLSQPELSLLALRIEDSLTLLEDLGLPEVVGHSDLNPGNVLVATDRCVFVDWAESHVGNPFLSFEYLLEHFRRTIGTDVALETRLSRYFCAPWRQLFSGDIITDALDLAPLAAVFAYAVGNDAWKNQEHLEDPKVASYFRSLARRMNWEAIRLADRRSLCLS
jgi:hypothetical protein